MRNNLKQDTDIKHFFDLLTKMPAFKDAANNKHFIKRLSDVYDLSPQFVSFILKIAANGGAMHGN